MAHLAVDRQTGRHIGKERQTGRHTDRQAGRQTERQTDESYWWSLESSLKKLCFKSIVDYMNWDVRLLLCYVTVLFVEVQGNCEAAIYELCDSHLLLKQVSS